MLLRPSSGKCGGDRSRGRQGRSLIIDPRVSVGYTVGRVRDEEGGLGGGGLFKDIE